MLTLLHGVTFARRVTFARGDIFARRHFCTRGHFSTASLLARCYNCMATFLQSFIFVRGNTFTEIFMLRENHKKSDNFERSLTFARFF